MTRFMMAALLSATALVGCQKAPAPGQPVPASASEMRIAEKLVDAGAIIPLDDETLQQVAAQQVQQMMQQDQLTNEQAQQLMLAVMKGLKADAPELKKQMIANLTEQFSTKEMDLLYKFVTSKEGEAIRSGMPEVGKKTQDQIFAQATVAGSKALAQMKAAWPLKAPPAPAPEPEPAKPGGKPAKPGAKPAPAPEPARPN